MSSNTNNEPMEYDVLSKYSTFSSITADKTNYEVEPNNEKNEIDKNDTTMVSGLGIQNNSFLRIVPMERKYGGWSTEHFHPDFKISTDDTHGFVILFQGMAKECIAIAISPQPKYMLGKTYAIHIGASGNQYTIIRRHITDDKCVEASYFTPQICSLKKYQSYWIYVQPKKGIVLVGVGNVPGKKCIAKLDDSSESLFEHNRGAGSGAFYYAGFGNSMLHKYNMGQQQYESQHIKIRRLSGISAPLQSEDVRPYENIHKSKNNVVIDKELVQEYNNQYEKARMRAQKFNIEFKGLPPIEEYFKNTCIANADAKIQALLADKRLFTSMDDDDNDIPENKERGRNNRKNQNTSRKRTLSSKKYDEKESRNNKGKRRKNHKKKNQDDDVDDQQQDSLLLHSGLKSKRTRSEQTKGNERMDNGDDHHQPNALSAGLKSKR